MVILCVDDESAVLKSIRNQLKRHFGDKFAIEIAERADEALEVFQELSQEDFKIVIVISDWLMPGMKGDEFLVVVHQQSPKTIKVMLTGQADQKAIQNAFDNASLYKCLAKPWNEDDLVETIKKAIHMLAPKENTPESP